MSRLYSVKLHAKAIMNDEQIKNFKYGGQGLLA